MKIRSYKALIPIIVIAVILIGLDFIAHYTQNSLQAMADEAELAYAEQEAGAAYTEEEAALMGPTLPAAVLEVLTDWVSLYEEAGIEVTGVDADKLFADHEGYVGTYVYTAFNISSTEGDMLKVKTDSNHSIYYSIVCIFDDPALIKDYKKGDTVAVMGKVQDENFTVTLTDCHVIASGKEAEEMLEELAER